MLVKFLKDNKGINTVEIVIILAILLGLALIFKDYITGFLNRIFDSINQDTNKVLNIIVNILR